MLTLTDVTIRRGPNPVVDGLDLEIRTGSVFWVVGPNGSGKTSLLRVLAGLDRPRSGTVRRLSLRVEPFLYFHSEMTLPPAVRVCDWDRLVRRLLPEPAPRTPLWPDVGPDRPVGRLSTGERKRLLLDALLRRSGSLLMDEPFEHLSPDAKRSLATILEDRARTTIVVVATNQKSALVERDGGLLLDGGHARRLTPRDAEVAR